MSDTDVVPADDPVDRNAGREPWEKRFKETGKSFIGFCVYRNLDPNERSLVRASELLADQQPGRKASSILIQIKDWSRRNDWPARVDAYDLHRDRKLREARESAADRNARLESQVATGVIHRISQRILGDAANGIDAVSIEEVGFGELVLAYRRLVEIRRVSDGQSMSIPGKVLAAREEESLAALPMLDISKLTDEELDLLIALHEKGRPGAAPEIEEGEFTEIVEEDD